MICLESKNASFVEHLLNDCNLIGKILEAENNFTLAADPNKVNSITKTRRFMFFLMLYKVLTDYVKTSLWTPFGVPQEKQHLPQQYIAPTSRGPAPPPPPRASLCTSESPQSSSSLPKVGTAAVFQVSLRAATFLVLDVNNWI